MTEQHTLADSQRYSYFLPNTLATEFAIMQDSEHMFSLAQGGITNYSYMNKFGRCTGFSTSMVDVASQATPSVYVWPQSAETLTIVSSSADDAAAGTGARTVIVYGLDTNFDEISETFTLNGVTPVVGSVQFRRIHRAYIATCGTYATTTAGTQAGNITITGTTSSTVHIYLNGTLKVGQTMVARYTIPNGYTGYMIHAHMSVDALKPVSFYLWQRQNADDTTAPVSAKRIIETYDGIASSFERSWTVPIKLPAKTDVWFSAIGAGSGSSASCSFDIILVRTDA